jgi:hypothetical protein
MPFIFLVLSYFTQAPYIIRVYEYDSHVAALNINSKTFRVASTPYLEFSWIAI